MNILLCILFLCPGIIATQLYIQLSKKKLCLRDYIGTWAEFTFLINWVNFIILYTRGWEEFSFTILTIQFLTKYSILCAIFSICLPAVRMLVDKFLISRKNS